MKHSRGYRTLKTARTPLIVLLLITFLSVRVAAQTQVPHEFETGQPAVAEEVNENFDALENAIDANGPYTGEAPVSVTVGAVGTIGLNPASSVGEVLMWDGSNWIAQNPFSGDTSVSNMQPYLTVHYIIALEGLYPSRSSINPFVGEIQVFAGTFAPRGWAFCDGQLLPIAQHTALFSLLGTTYGGDGRTTFALPDLRGRAAVHAGTGPGLTERRLGERGGNETVLPR